MTIVPIHLKAQIRFLYPPRCTAPLGKDFGPAWIWLVENICGGIWFLLLLRTALIDRTLLQFSYNDRAYLQFNTLSFLMVNLELSLLEKPVIVMLVIYKMVL